MGGKRKNWTRKR